MSVASKFRDFDLKDSFRQVEHPMYRNGETEHFPSDDVEWSIQDFPYTYDRYGRLHYRSFPFSRSCENFSVSRSCESLSNDRLYDPFIVPESLDSVAVSLEASEPVDDDLLADPLHGPSRLVVNVDNDLIVESLHEPSQLVVNVDNGSSSKMMSEHPLIMDSGYITLKTEMNDVSYYLSDPEVVASDMIEQNMEIGSENNHGEVVLIHNSSIKQEDCIEGEEVVSNVDNEVIIDESMVDAHLDPDHFIGSSIVIGADQFDEAAFDDTKLIIDTEQYNSLEVEAAFFQSPKPFICGECHCKFKSKNALKRHVRSQHTLKAHKSKSKKGSSKEKVAGGNQRYFCDCCNYSSCKRDKLDKHMEKHVLQDGVHPCGKRRHKPEALPKRHRHNAEEYRCTQCPYTCTIAKAFKKHQKVHLSGREALFMVKLSCKICGKDRPSESELQRHMKKHKNDNNFLCDLCDFTSVQLKKVIQHRRMHTGEKPHLCPHCQYRAARRDNLRSHVRRMHKRTNMFIDTFNPNEVNILPSY